MSKIFVFGSNTKGYRGEGAALATKQLQFATRVTSNSRGSE